MNYQNTNMFRIMSICLTILFLGLMSASITHAETKSYTLNYGNGYSADLGDGYVINTWNGGVYDNYVIFNIWMKDTSANISQSFVVRLGETYNLKPSLDIPATVRVDTISRDHKTVQITVDSSFLPPNPVAAFYANPTSGITPLTVSFTDLSKGSPTSWLWDFGDKSTSTAQSPKHTYTKVGNYTVILKVKNSVGSNTATESNYIKVIPVPPPVARFIATPTTGKAPLTVTFTDTSTNKPFSWSWKFGDGSISKVKNPMHKYTKKGTYSVSLTVTNAGGSSSVTKSKYIVVK